MYTSGVAGCWQDPTQLWQYSSAHGAPTAFSCGQSAGQEPEPSAGPNTLHMCAAGMGRSSGSGQGSALPVFYGSPA